MLDGVLEFLSMIDTHLSWTQAALSPDSGLGGDPQWPDYLWRLNRAALEAAELADAYRARITSFASQFADHPQAFNAAVHAVEAARSAVSDGLSRLTELRAAGRPDPTGRLPRWKDLAGDWLFYEVALPLTSPGGTPPPQLEPDADSPAGDTPATRITMADPPDLGAVFRPGTAEFTELVERLALDAGTEREVLLVEEVDGAWALWRVGRVATGRDVGAGRGPGGRPAATPGRAGPARVAGP